jgi:hypothetical protein
MKILRLIINTTLGGILALGLVGCQHSLGQFTVASSHNVRNLDYTTENKVRVSDSACARNLFGIIPLSQQDDLLQRATDNAIRDGQSSFFGKEVDGDMLVNVRITADTTTLIIYNDTCYNVEGDLVKLNTK